jgi:hypothetical protein
MGRNPIIQVENYRPTSLLLFDWATGLFCNKHVLCTCSLIKNMQYSM